MFFRFRSRGRFAALLALVSLLVLTSHVQAAPPLPTAAPESVGMSKERLAKIGPAMQAVIDDGGFPGAVLLIARKGKLVYANALGNQTPARKMGDDALFRIYSMTKPLVSVAAMMLVEEGKLQLTDPVGKYLPGFDKIPVSVESGGAYSMVEARRAMTVQDLLRHSSGLTYANTTGNVPVKEGYQKEGVTSAEYPGDPRRITAEEMIERLAKVPLAHHPGTVWNYGFSTDVLGRVVEKASGMRLGDFLRQRLLAPLKMNDTGFWPNAAQQARLAEPLPKDKATGEPNVLIDVSQVLGNDAGGMGGVSTANDYIRFTQMLLNGGTLDGTRYLSRNTVKLMASDHLGTDVATPLQPGELLLGVKGYTFGLGFAVRKEDGIAGVPGSQGEFTWGGFGGTYFWIDPKEQLTAVFMTQAPGPMRQYYRRMVRALVYAALGD